MIRKFLNQIADCSPHLLLSLRDAPRSHQRSQSRTNKGQMGYLRALCLWIFMILSAALVAGCGPSKEKSSGEDASDSTREIAYAYASDRDLDTAQSALAGLGVANTNQWLVLVAEQTIAEGPSGDADALTMLALDLGLHSSIVDRYATQRGFIPSVASASGAPSGIAPTPTREAATGAAVSQSVAQSVTSSSTESAPVAAVTTAVTTADPATAEPSQTTVEEVPTVSVPATETPVPVQEAQVQVGTPMNVRAGPSTDHPIVAAMQANSTATILAKNSGGDWWQISMSDGSVGWIYAPLVNTVGNVGSVSVAAAVPTAPPPAATSAPQPTQEAPAVGKPTVVEVPTAAVVAEATPTPGAPAGGPDFRLVEQRLWGVEENGGRLAGTSVNCGEKQVLRVVVEDANGSPLNGVTVQGVYRNELHTTGEKGEGIAEMDMNVNGDDVIVLRGADGSEVTSDRAAGNTARTYDIPFDQLIQGRFCSDGASCQAFVDTTGCFGHFSWTVRFRRSY